MPKETDKHETREAILEAAERLMDRYGYNKMTMNDLAEEAQIGVGTTYLYFSSKAAVALGVVERFNMHVQRTLEKSATKNSPPEQRLREMLIGRVMLRFEAVSRHRHPMEEFRTDVQAEINARRVQWQADEARIAEALLTEGQAAGVFQVGDIAATADTLLCATGCLMPRYLTADELAHPQRVREKTEQMADLLLRALRP